MKNNRLMEKIFFQNVSSYPWCSTKFKMQLFHGILVMKESPKMFNYLHPKLLKHPDIIKIVHELRMEHLLEPKNICNHGRKKVTVPKYPSLDFKLYWACLLHKKLGKNGRTSS